MNKQVTQIYTFLLGVMNTFDRIELSEGIDVRVGTNDGVNLHFFEGDVSCDTYHCAACTSACLFAAHTVEDLKLMALRLARDLAFEVFQLEE